MQYRNLLRHILFAAFPLLIISTIASAGRHGGGGRLIPIGTGTAHLRSLTPYLTSPRSRDEAEERIRRLAERQREIHQMGLRHHRSLRRILARPHRPRTPVQGAPTGVAAAGDTVLARVAALRVEFADPGRATRGRFDQSAIWDPDREDTLMIDPPPHDSLFVAKHLEALSEFYEAMFYGQLQLDYQVFPAGATGAYELESLGVYGDFDPDETGAEWTVDGLEWLVKDCLRAADADSNFRFQDWDAYMIIHAGPDFQTDINRDSPDDIPSFYIYFGDTLWVDVTETDSFPVVDASMIPESVSQDGLVGGINGVIAHEFGHQLGLPDLYDVFTGLPMIGYWGLMDSGPNVAIDLGYPVSGILPGSLCAWSRYLLSRYLAGGLDFLDVRRVETVWDSLLPAVEVGPIGERGRVLQVPLTEEEFYLIENRQDDVDGNRATVVGDELVILEDVFGPAGPDTLVGALFQEPERGVILGPTKFVTRDSSGELPPFREMRSWEYDAGLPGTGLLVWHIDDEVIFDLGIDSTGWAVNSDFDRRGVALEEADGIPDLGDWRSFYWLGSPFDPFYLENADSLTPTSTPNTSSNLGGATGVSITGIGPRGAVMPLRVDRGYGVEGFPLWLTDRGEPGSLGEAGAAGDVNGDGEPDLLLARGGRLYALAGGAPASGSMILDGWPVESGAAEVGPLSLGDLDGDGIMEVAARTSRGRLAAWRGGGERYFDMRPEWGAAFTDSLSVMGGPPMLVDLDGDGRDEIVAAVGRGVTAYADSAGLPRARWTMPVGRLSREGSSEVVALAAVPFAAGQDGLVAVLLSTGEAGIVRSTGELLIVWQAGESDVFAGGGYLVLGDFYREEAGTEEATEVMTVGAGGFVAVYQSDGSLLPGSWPVELDGSVSGPPAVADVDGDGYLEAVIPLEGFGLSLLRQNGVPQRGSPWPAPVGPEASPLVVDLENDGAMEVLLAAADGSVYGWWGDGTPLPGWPLGLGRAPLGPAAVADWRSATESPELAVMDGIGAVAMVKFPGWASGGEVVWEGAFGGASRTSHFTGALGSPVTSASLISDEGVFVYPNPARGVDPRLRLELGREAQVSIRVFSLSGELVTEWGGHRGPLDDEWEWDLGDAASGLYLMRIRVEDESAQSSFTRMVAVIR